MTFAKWKNQKSLPATATLATFATHEQKIGFKNLTVASVATVAVATGENEKVLMSVCEIELNKLSALGGGDNFVISANNTNAQAANDPPPKGEALPVIPKSVRQVEPPKHTATHSQPYATDELLTRYEKPLFNHLLACPYCHIEKAQYCTKGYAMGSVYDALLLNRDDAQARRESLALRVDRACISGRSVYVSFSSIDAPPPPMQTAPITRKYGNTHEYETFINHWTACEVCKPNLGRYCSEGQRLEKEANNSYS